MTLENNNLQNPQEEDSNKRYVVKWGCDIKNQCTRYIVIVYDKFVGKVIYTANTGKLKRELDYVRGFYGEQNCIPPRQKGIPIDLRKYF